MWHWWRAEEEVGEEWIAGGRGRDGDGEEGLADEHNTTRGTEERNLAAKWQRLSRTQRSASSRAGCSVAQAHKRLFSFPQFGHTESTPRVSGCDTHGGGNAQHEASGFPWKLA